jgi:hypothetical protein
MFDHEQFKINILQKKTKIKPFYIAVVYKNFKKMTNMDTYISFYYYTYSGITYKSLTL